MLAVDGDQLGAALFDFTQENVTGGDEALLVGQGDAATLTGCGERGAQPCGADDRRHDAVRGLGGCRFHGGGAGCDRNSGSGQVALELGKAGFVTDDGLARIVAHRELGETGGVALRGESHDLIRFGRAADEIQRAHTD